MSNSTFTSSSSVAPAVSSSSVEASISSAIASSVSSQVLGDTTTTVEPSTTNVVTSIISASSVPPTTNIITSVVTQSASSDGSVNTNPVTVVVTSVGSPSTATIAVAGSTSVSSAPSSTSSSPASLQNNGSTTSSSSGGLSTAGKTAVAVVVPVVVVALLVLAGLFLWRKRKQKKETEEQRRKEIHDYGFNPNNDPTLPTVASEGPQMTQDQNSGYRGWGGAATASNRKASTTLSGGHTQGQLSDTDNSYHSPSSPGGGNSDGHSGDPLVNKRETMDSDDLGALGAAPLAASNNQGMRRGPSNASSHYSNAARSEGSDEPVPQLPSQAYDYNPNNGNYGYGQHGPYGDGSYGGGQESGMPVVRDVSARRNTRIQQGGQYQQGNSGIAQNF